MWQIYSVKSYLKNHLIFKIVLLGLCIYLPLLYSSQAVADITRGCSADLVIQFPSVTPESSRSIPYRPIYIGDYQGFIEGWGVRTIFNFDGRGKCKNRLNANSCRRSARDYLFQCMNDLWNDRLNYYRGPDSSIRSVRTLPPQSCSNRGSIGVNLINATHFKRYTLDIKYTMEHSACCRIHTQADNLTMRLVGVSFGDVGCGATSRNTLPRNKRDVSIRTIFEDYGANCQALREAGMCAKRTGS